jgi:hypothetical protein
MDRIDEEVIVVPGNCRAAMNSGGKILVFDLMLPNANTLIQTGSSICTSLSCTMARIERKHNFVRFLIWPD